jgi:hypothetical protein
VLWFTIKHSLQRARQTPYQRGLYERLFQHLEDQYPNLWTSQGAIPDVQPDTSLRRWKWSLLKRWFAPEKTIDETLYRSLAESGATDDLSHVDRVKRFFLLRWLPQIRIVQESPDQNALAETGNHRHPAADIGPSRVSAFANTNGVVGIAVDSRDAGISVQPPSRPPSAARTKTTSGHSEASPKNSLG